jgi:hypothetical protein
MRNRSERRMVYRSIAVLYGEERVLRSGANAAFGVIAAHEFFARPLSKFGYREPFSVANGIASAR